MQFLLYLCSLNEEKHLYIYRFDSAVASAGIGGYMQRVRMDIAALRFQFSVINSQLSALNSILCLCFSLLFTMQISGLNVS